MNRERVLYEQGEGCCVKREGELCEQGGGAV